MPPFGEPTTDVARRGPEQYNELTTDVSGRGEPYVPAPALPSFPPSGQPENDRPMMGGLFPGPATRATVTPPTPEDTTSWPGVEAQESRFDQFKPEAEEAPPAKPETPHVRILPILLAVVVGAALLVGLAFGIVYLVAGGDKGDTASGFSVNTGDCVKKSGDSAVKADCSEASTFQVVSIADDKSKCADPQQPYVVNPTKDGKSQVLCLKPNG
jgi:hypothetical protein